MTDIERHEDEGAKAFDPHLARRLLRYLAPYRLRASVSVGLVILSSLLEIAGPAIVAVAIDLYVKPSQGAHVAGVSQRIGAWLVAHGWALDPLSGINLAAAIYFLALFGGFAVLYTQMVLMNLMGQYIMYDLRKQIFGHLQKLDIQFFDRNPVGRLMTRVTTDVDALNDMFTAGFVSIFGDIFVLAGIVGVLFWMNWRMALVLFSIIPLIILASAWFRARRPHHLPQDPRAHRRHQRLPAGAHLRHGHGAALQPRGRRGGEVRRPQRAASRRQHRVGLLLLGLLSRSSSWSRRIGVALIVWYGGGQVIQGTLSIGALVAFFQYAQRFYEPISDLSEKYNILQAAMAASERVFKLLDTPPRILDDGTIEIDHFESIEFRNVSFAYNEPEWVLKDVSFTVTRGERVALVGHTGAGKTTVTSLLLRFYEPQRGEILVNGIDIRRYTIASLRSLFAIVQQDFFLFTGTIAQNISLGDPDISPDTRARSRHPRAGRPLHPAPAGRL